MHLDLTLFSDWLTCQYPHSSARKHIISDLALFFLWAGKPPSEISPQDVDQYICHCLKKSLSPSRSTAWLSSLRLFIIPQCRLYFQTAENQRKANWTSVTTLRLT